MKRWLISEGMNNPTTQGEYDGCFSFKAAEGNLHVSDVLHYDENKQLYDEAIKQVNAVFDQLNAFVGTYRDVRLARCFYKKLVDCMIIGLKRHACLERVLESRRDVVYTVHEGDIVQNEVLALILSCSSLGNHANVRIKPCKQSEGSGLSMKREELPPAQDPLGKPLSLGIAGLRQTVVYADLNKSKKVMRALGFRRCVYYSDSQSLKTFWNVTKRGGQYYQALPRSCSKHNVRIQELVEKLRRYPDFDEVDQHGIQVSQYLSSVLIHLLKSLGSELLHHIDLVHEFYEKHPQLKTALLDEDVTAKKNSFCQIAAMNGVKSVVESHGALGHRAGFVPLTADKICVWGQYQRNKLMEWGSASARIVITGCSRYEDYSHLSSITLRRKFCKQWDVSENKVLILVAFTSMRSPWIWCVDDAFKLYQEILSIAQGEENVHLVIKLHHGEDVNYRQHLVKLIEEAGLQSRTLILDKGDPLKIMKACDVVLAYQTTMAIDALAMQKPVISLRHQTHRMFSEFESQEVFYCPKTPNELHSLIKKHVSGECELIPLRKEVSDGCLHQDSSQSSAEKVKETLMHLEESTMGTKVI